MATGIRERQEHPTERTERLTRSFTRWLEWATESLKRGKVEEAIELTDKASETGRTLRKHLTGV